MDTFTVLLPGYGTVKGTYLGTNDYDQAYFVQLDIDNYVYVYGQTKVPTPLLQVTTLIPIADNLYKISNDLTTTQWSSVFGRGSGNEEISPCFSRK
ncbi:MAG: hypothetical protein IPH66_15980 [Crocinitomicaceae bacterium]|nr:hypothetical protein [Crocinitomicaceae bacterium]